jgi:hypothetical protein
MLYLDLEAWAISLAGWLTDDAELCGLACRRSTASIHRNITTAVFTSQTHYNFHNLDTHSITGTRNLHTTTSHTQTATMVQTTGMLGEGTQIHERMMGK